MNVQKIGKAIRKEILSWKAFEADLACACCIASYMLWKALKKLGEDPDLVFGYYEDSEHCWVELKGKVIDLTATQFDLTHEVYITSYNKNTGYQPEKCNRSVLDELHKWPEDQSPDTFRPKIEAFLKQLSV
jgi:hypothetical protein